MMKRRLFTPGPTPVPERVLLRMAEPIIHHRKAEYRAIAARVNANLRTLFETARPVLTLTSLRDRGRRGLVREPFFARRQGDLHQWRKIRGAMGQASPRLRAQRRRRDGGVGADDETGRAGRRPPRAPGRESRLHHAERNVDGHLLRRRGARGDGPRAVRGACLRRRDFRHGRPRTPVRPLGGRRLRHRVPEGVDDPPGAGVHRAQRARGDRDETVDAPPILFRSQKGPRYSRDGRHALDPGRVARDRAGHRTPGHPGGGPGSGLVPSSEARLGAPVGRARDGTRTGFGIPLGGRDGRPAAGRRRLEEIQPDAGRCLRRGRGGGSGRLEGPGLQDLPPRVLRRTGHGDRGRGARTHAFRLRFPGETGIRGDGRPGSPMPPARR